jgi:hypothetical protein
VLLVACGRASVPEGAGPDAPSTDDPAIDAPVGENDAPPTGGRGIAIYSGDGIMAMQGWPGGDELKVQITDAAHQPLAGVEVVWDVTAGGMAITGAFQTGSHGTTLTDASGLARVGVRGEFASQMFSAIPSTIRAAIPEGSVELHGYSTYYQPNIPAMPHTLIVSPSDIGTYPPGAVVPAALVVQVAFQAGDRLGQGAPGIGVRFHDRDHPDAAPPAACVNAASPLAGGTVFTDAQGVATCDVRVPQTPGFHGLTVRVGGAIDHTLFVRVQ